MAGVWADFPSGSPGRYGNSTAAMLDGPWAQLQGLTLSDDPDPAIGSAGKVLFLNSTTTSRARAILPSPQAKVGVAQRFFDTSLPANRAGPRIIEWRSAANALMGYVYVTSTGALAFMLGNSSDADPTFVTPGPVITPNAWWHIECCLTAGVSSDAEIEIRVNGAVKMSETGFSTSAGSIGQYALANGSYSSVNDAGGYRKDLVVWDGSGSENNDFLGSVTAFFRCVVSDITLGGWTCSSGSSGSDLIGVAGPPVDTNYIAANDAPPAAAEFELEDLPDDVTSIRFIVPFVRAAKVDGGDGDIQLGISPNGVDYDTGPNTPITSAMTYWGNPAAPYVSEINPETLAPWTPSDFNGSRLKIDRTV